MKLLLVMLLAMFLFIPTTAHLQGACFSYGGGIISCDSNRGNTTIAPFSNAQGVITHDGRSGSSLEPYTLFQPPPSRRHSESFTSRPIEPLGPLDRLDRLDGFDRHDDPLNDPLLPLLLGE